MPYANEPLEPEDSVVMRGPWTVRTGSDGESSSPLDRLAAKIDRLEHQGDIIKVHVSELMDNAQQASRLRSLAESLRNARELKLDELQRSIKDLKGRVEQMQGPRAEYAALTYRSFGAVDGKLREIDELKVLVTDLKRAVKLASVLFGGSILVLIGALAVISA